MSDPFNEQQDGLPGFEHKDGPWVPISLICEYYGEENEDGGITPLTERAVQLWAEKKYFIKNQRGLYHLPSVVRGVYRAHLAVINKKKGPEGEQYNDLDLREKRATVEEKELKVLKMKEKFLDREKVKNEAFEEGQRVKEALENLSSRVAPLLAAETDQGKCRDIIDREIHQILENLSTC